MQFTKFVGIRTHYGGVRLGKDGMNMSPILIRKIGNVKVDIFYNKKKKNILIKPTRKAYGRATNGFFKIRLGEVMPLGRYGYKRKYNDGYVFQLMEK